MHRHLRLGLGTSRIASAELSLQLYEQHLGSPRCAGRPRCPQPSPSWDGYLFRRPLPPLHSSLLSHDIYMNQMGAENRAGLTLLAANATDRIYSLCGWVELVDYHCSATMHHGGETRVDPSSAEWAGLFPGRPLPPGVHLNSARKLVLSSVTPTGEALRVLQATDLTGPHRFD